MYDLPVVENLAKNILKEKQPFERLEVKKEKLLEMFKVCLALFLLVQVSFRISFIIIMSTVFQYNPFKQRILNEKVQTPKTTIYRCGPLIDLCRGPHVRHTGSIKALKVTKVNMDDFI